MEVGGDAGSAKIGHEGYGVSTAGQGGVRSADAEWEVEAGDAIPGVELFSSSRSEVKEKETGVARPGV